MCFFFWRCVSTCVVFSGVVCAHVFFSGVVCAHVLFFLALCVHMCCFCCGSFDRLLYISYSQLHSFSSVDLFLFLLFFYVCLQSRSVLWWLISAISDWCVGEVNPHFSVLYVTI